MAKDTRIQKALSEWGVCSRRKAEEYLRDGKIAVNGHPAQLGDKIDTRRDRVTLNGELVSRTDMPKHHYLMLYKPRGYVTTMQDERGRRCVTQLIDESYGRVFPIGRPDKDSEGLLLLTNDGEFANGMMHPSNKIEKGYRVTVNKDISDGELVTLLEGTEIDGRHAAPKSVLVLEKRDGRTVLHFVLTDGRNREIRRLCEAAQLEVIRLKRTHYGCLKLGMLRPGECRELKSEEVKALWDLAGRVKADGKKRGKTYKK